MATPSGATQAAAGALPVQGGGDQNAAIVAALTQLIAVLNQLVAALQQQAATGGGPVQKNEPDAKGGGVPTQSPLQVPTQKDGVTQGGGAAAPTPTPPAAPVPGAQPATPTTGGGATAPAADGHAHAH